MFVSHSGELLDVFRHETAIYGVSTDPLNDNIFTTASHDGRVLIYDMRDTPSEGILLTDDLFVILCHRYCFFICLLVSCQIKNYDKTIS